MAKVEITQSPDGKVDYGDSVTLTASPTAGYDFAWTKPNQGTAKGLSISVCANEKNKGLYTVVATPNAGGPALDDGKHELLVGDPSTAEAPLEFAPLFAFLTALGVGALAVLFILPLMRELYSGDHLESDLAEVARLTTLTLLAIGGGVIFVGAYGGLLEVRGRMRIKEKLPTPPTPPRGADEGLATATSVVSEVIKGGAAIVDSVGKLRGASLVLIVGCIPLLAAAWVAQSGVSGELATATTTSTAAGTGTPANTTPEPIATTTAAAVATATFAAEATETCEAATPPCRVAMIPRQDSIGNGGRA